MLDLETRTAILRLHREGHGSRGIAKALGVSRNAVKDVIRSGQAEVPRLERADLLTPHIDRVRELHHACRGNLVRVTEELRAERIPVAYTTVTAFCRRHEIGVTPKRRAGEYHFEPSQEMQHDTSPHTVEVGGRRRLLQCASLVFCYSRRRYAQLYPRYDRFACRLFLSEAICAVGGAAGDCMIDNSSVVIASGRGPNAVPAPEMKALADRFGFEFVAHEVGDADRSGRVERPFHHIENNFYPGRTFEDLADLNAQLRDWCDRYNSTWNRWLQASPMELFAVERPLLRPLPLHVPEVYDLHHRRIDVSGYVTLHTNRYSVDDELLGRQVRVHETRDHVRVFDGHRLVVQHDKREHGARQRVTLPEHRYLAKRRLQPPPPSDEERRLRAAAPELGALMDVLRKRHGGQAKKAVRRLMRIWEDYDDELVIRAVARALDFGLIDLGRIETMVLESVRGDFFHLPTNTDPDSEDDDE